VSACTLAMCFERHSDAVRPSRDRCVHASRSGQSRWHVSWSLDCREEGYDTRLVRLCATAIIRVDSVFVFEQMLCESEWRGAEYAQRESRRVVRRPKIHLAVPAAWGARWGGRGSTAVHPVDARRAICCRALALLIVRCSHRHSYRQRRQPSELVEDDVDACAHNLHACS
jgi:hypothetical protein